ncbi:glycoside hydrolase family 9 protein [Bowmanella dokdonensis]|uniref:Endoglucanase n=1 Tax=Bowmanella dokdonensis TaxID=751969 RepID=A0A939DPN1_9ALTE|nr:glycoside hydrolase family 9 protein [Bowmanella dokdonensis]MBN7825651.1 glycoside hydrolase family 9 protein [Bowmanella dokdonensis]
MTNPGRHYLPALLIFLLAGCGSDAESPGIPVANGALTGQAETAVVKLNQLGFLPGADKLAVIPATGNLPFKLVSEDGQVRFSGRSSELMLWPPAGEQVSVADFSALQESGNYQLQVEGLAPIAVSIGGQVYQKAHDGAIKAYYFNRASLELAPENAGVWARPAGHPDERVRVHASAASPDRPAGTLIFAPRGWYDAGDYNKYVVNSGISTYTLLRAWTDFRSFYVNRQWQIPESTNALPDLLDEVLWNLDWMRAMQDPGDGGVYHKLTTLNFAGAVMPHQATAERYVVQKTTSAALNYAAVMALASRVLDEFSNQLPGLGPDYRQSAELAWQWALQHPQQAYQQPEDVSTGAYGDQQLQDEFAWAAAELYLATGESTYLQAFLDRDAPITEASWSDVAALGYFSLAGASHSLDEETLQLVRARILAAADCFVGQHQQSAYKVAMEEADFVWGSNAVALNKAVLLYQAWQLKPEPVYLQAAQGLVDYVLGRNPTDYSYLTGFGNKPPLHIHHRPSEADGIAQPVPGWLAGGAQPGWQDGCAYPSRLPAKSYLDDWCSYSTNEITINWNAPLVYMLAGLSSLAEVESP